MPPRLPTVAIVGRQNVGKSSLFNRLARRRISIVDPKPGTTLDRLEHVIEYKGRKFKLVDTGGLGIDPHDPYKSMVERQITYAIQSADVIIFLCDAQGGVTAVETELARRLRTVQKPVVLGVNKVDHPAHAVLAADFHRLGFDPQPLSVTGNRGIEELMDRVLQQLPAFAGPVEVSELTVAIVGKRNVGKSTYLNALVGEERVIVSEIPGTTRDAVDVVIERGPRRYTIVDTAGIYKRTRVKDSVELFSQMRTAESVERAEAVMFMMDAHLEISAMDKHIGRLIEKHNKSCVIAFNKWDLIPPAERNTDRFLEYIEKRFPVLYYVPLAFMSARTGLNIWEPLETLAEVVETSRRRVTTGLLNRVIELAGKTAPPPMSGTKAGKIFYATQTGILPPTFTLFVNYKEPFTPAFLRHFERALRETTPFKNTPIRLQVREKRKKV